MGGAYYITNHKEPAQPEAAQPQQQEQTQEAQAGSYTGSLADLAKRGGSWKCTVDSSTAQAASSGIVYVSGDMVRGDFTSTIQGYGSVGSHLLVNDGYSYSWSSMMPQGIKTKVTTTGDGGTATSGSGADVNHSYSYDCAPWTADASLFTVPTDVTFQTY